MTTLPSAAAGPARWSVRGPRARQEIMRKHITSGALGNIWGHLISGLFFVYFGSTVGLTRLQWGFMSAISSWTILSQLFSARLTQRIGQRKRIWFWFAVAERGVRFAGIVGSFLLWRAGSHGASLVLMTAVCLSNLFGTMGQPPWMSWLADIIPRRMHGAFWGARNMWISASAIAVVVPVGFLLDRVPEAAKPQVTLLVLCVATVIGFADVLIHRTIPEPPAPVSRPGEFLQDILVPLRDRRFRPWLVFEGVWNFGVSLGGSLGTLYFVTELGISNNFFGGAIVLTALNLVGPMLTSRLSGRLVDRIGIRRVLYGGHFLWALLPFWWLIATPGNALIVLAAASLVGGTGSSAASSASTKLITRFPPPDRRATYVAVSSGVGCIASGLGATLAGVTLQLLSGAPERFLELSGNGFRVLFLASLALRMGSTLVLVPRIAIEPGDSPSSTAGAQVPASANSRE